MHSVKSETECITTIGTVNSRLAHTLAMRTEAKITFLLQTVACLQGLKIDLCRIFKHGNTQAYHYANNSVYGFNGTAKSLNCFLT